MTSLLQKYLGATTAAERHRIKKLVLAENELQLGVLKMQIRKNEIYAEGWRPRRRVMPPWKLGEPIERGRDDDEQ